MFDYQNPVLAGPVTAYPEFIQETMPLSQSQVEDTQAVQGTAQATSVSITGTIGGSG
jgi:hypothetical protein